VTNFASTGNTKFAFVEEVMQNLLLFHRHNMVMVMGYGVLAAASSI